MESVLEKWFGTVPQVQSAARRSRNMEIKTLADRAAEQIAVYPAITGKEKLKRFAKRSILRQKLAPIDPFSWPNAMLGEGLLAAFEAAGDPQYLQAVVEHLKRWKKAGYPIHYVDNIMNGSLALWIEALILEEGADCGQKASGVGTAHKLAGIDNAGEAVLALCRETEEACALWVRRAVRTKQGILPYRSQHPDWLFVDTLGMICPFLCRYGAVKRDGELLRLGASQLVRFWEKGMDPGTGLPYHGYDEKSGMKYGIIGWGRACGWMLKGLAESLPYIPREWEEYEILRAAFCGLTETVCCYQRPDGGFSWQLEALEGHRDTSAEGMIGAAAARGLRFGMPGASGGQAEPGMAGKTGDLAEKMALYEAEAAAEVQTPPAYETCLTRLAGALGQSVSDGIVRDCSGECRGFAEYPQTYGTYPWGSGSALEFFAVMEN